MADLCRRCASIDFEDGAYYALSSVGVTTQSAARGCAGCKFFLDVLQSIDVEGVDKDTTQLLLEKISNEDNRVDLCFMGKDVKYLSHVRLRLCSAYGKETHILEVAGREVDAD
jgi:hypothetical protein